MDDLRSAIDFWCLGEFPSHHDHKILPHLIKMFTSRNNFTPTFLGSTDEQEFLLSPTLQTSMDGSAPVNTHKRFFPTNTSADYFIFLLSCEFQHPSPDCKALFTSVRHFWGFMFKEETKICSIDNKSVEKSKMLTCLLGGEKP